MSYVGPRPDSQIYAQPAIDYFSGNGSTTSFTLSRPVVSTAQMIVSVANVIQNPGSAFTVNGTTLQFTGTPPAGTNNIWVQYTTPITQINQPGQGTVGTTQMMDAAVTAAKIADTTITPSKLTVGAISWDSSGRVTMPYQPAFFARYTAGDPSTGVIVWNTTDFNIGSCYNSSNGRFTAPVSGTYFFSTVCNGGVGVNNIALRFSKNGATPAGYQVYITNVDDSPYLGAPIYLSLGDWVDVRTDVTSIAGTPWSHFSGYLIG